MPDPLKAADDALYFKRFVKGIARKYELAASFMAKPFLDRAGNGFHVHFSLLDRDGKNVFDNGTADGSEVMRHAVGGILSLMRASSLVFAPHRNSYRRLTPNAHVASEVGWGYETRAAAVRIPGGANAARRIEHRVAGADANPYLVLAAVLGRGARGDGEPHRAAGADGDEPGDGAADRLEVGDRRLRAQREPGAGLRSDPARDLPRDEEAGAAGLLAADQRLRARDLPGDRVMRQPEDARLQAPTLRVARPTDDLDALLPFYRDGLGFEVLDRFEGHEGFDGVMLGHHGAPYHLEFTRARGHTAGRAPTRDNLLVLYIPDATAWAAAV